MRCSKLPVEIRVALRLEPELFKAACYACPWRAQGIITSNRPYKAGTACPNIWLSCWVTANWGFEKERGEGLADDGVIREGSPTKCM